MIKIVKHDAIRLNLNIYKRMFYDITEVTENMATAFDPDQLHYSQLPFKQGVVSFTKQNCVSNSRQ